MSTDIRVALVYQQDEGSKALRGALANAGVAIAIERRASELDSAAIIASDVDAIVVNLDPELEELLDEVTEALDAATQPVIFNDPAASSDLSGWDRARWLRHLSAKLKGRTDVTPPPPPGAQAIPMPAPRAVSSPAVTPMEQRPPAEPEAPVAIVPAPAEPQAEISLADLDSMFGAPENQVEAPSEHPRAALTIGEDIGDLDAFFEQSVEMVDLEPQPAAAISASPRPELPVPDAGDTLDLDALFASPDDAATGESTIQMASAEELNELDALFAQAPAVDAGNAPFSPAATAGELQDLDALFQQFEASQKVDAAVAKEPPGEVPKDEPAKSTFGLLSAEWSLEEIEEEKRPDPRLETGKLVAEWRLDVPAKPASAAPVAAKPEVPAPKVVPGPNIPEHLEASLASVNLQLLDDSSAPTPPAAPAAGEIEALDLSGIGFDDAPLSAPTTTGVVDELSLTDIEFDLDLGQASASAPAGIQISQFDADLGDLDSLFEAVPATRLSLPDLSRLFVLGASIGGPEAIKAFLARLPASVPAAFIVAQHMGSEFLEMMATQLDAATAMSVRYPKSGERLRHGEVLVAPANEHLTLDAQGCVQLSAAPSGSPYSPSIDQLAHVAADRFGDHATLILFSGMGTDAIEGGRYLSSRGGQVWAQDRASCVIATMIDAARAEGLLRFEGSPVQLAERVLELVS